MSTDPVQLLAAHVRADLRGALRRRDRAAASPLREILALVDQPDRADEHARAAAVIAGYRPSTAASS